MSRYDVSNGVTNTGLNLNYDSMYVSSGSVANRITLAERGFLYVSSGGRALSTSALPAAP